MDYLALNFAYNMDCLEGIKQVRSNSVQLIVADPPYFLGMTSNGKKGSFSDLNICKPFYAQLFSEFDRVLVEGGEVYLFCDWRSVAFYQPIFSAVLEMKNCLVWNKGFGRVNYCYCSSHEFLLFAVKGTASHKHYVPIILDIKGYSSRGDKATIHGTEKPLDLIEYLVTQSSNKGEVVLDPFLGSGTTAVACQKLRRSFIGFELDSKNFDIIEKRLTAKK